MVQRVGVLALQGGYEAHERLLKGLGKEVVRVKTPADLEAVDGLVLPGGESSTMLKLIAWNQLDAPLNRFVAAGKPVFSTCAGLILAATHVSHPEQTSFGWLDVDVSRNAWGRQTESFEATDDAGRYRMVFIRAPRITRVGDGAEVIASFRGEPVAVRSRTRPIYAATFHPELADEPALHQLAFG